MYLLYTKLCLLLHTVAYEFIHGLRMCVLKPITQLSVFCLDAGKKSPSKKQYTC